MFILAHLSDPHLPMPRPRLAELAGKRMLGFLNWQCRRRFEHRREVLEQIVGDLESAAPDHIAVTGDLVNLALPGEFAPALALLARLGPPHRVTFVPGNHDTYVRATMEHSFRHWGAYMAGEEPAASLPPSECFPFVRRRGSIALIGLSTAIPTAPFMATGKLGSAQLTRLGEQLARLGGEGAFRIVLLHHPPAAFARDRFKRLLDAAALRRVLAAHGAELVLHGHSHRHSLAWLKGPAGPIPAVGVPSASAAAGHEDDPAAYNLYHIAQETGGWRCEMISRGFSARRQGVSEIGRRIFCG
jgi:3',5'-cyclic AMP phosphodiesterase CpdA